MIVRIKLYRSNTKIIEHLDVIKTSNYNDIYIVHCATKKYKYPYCNLWWAEEEETVNKPPIHIQHIRIDNDHLMEKDLKLLNV